MNVVLMFAKQDEHNQLIMRLEDSWTNRYSSSKAHFWHLLKLLVCSWSSKLPKSCLVLVMFIFMIGFLFRFIIAALYFNCCATRKIIS